MEIESIERIERKTSTGGSNPLNDIWVSSCCRDNGTRVNKSFLKYMIQVLFSLILLIFSIIQIILLDDDDKSIYFSLISLIIGVYTPVPNHDDDE